MTSVKEFRIEEPATETDLGAGAFVFTDDYSVFDWGKMPDSIPNKGASLCAMGAANFERLEAEGIPTHYRGVVSGGEVVALSEAVSPPREMAIELTQVPDLPHDGREYDYEAFHADAGENYLIPLEIVFRNTVPVGSSLRSRADPEAFGLDYEEWPDEPVDLPEPVVEFSTKFEESDRYLSRSNADYIAGKADIDDLESVARDVNTIVTETAAEAGLKHEDGKIECLYFDGEIRVADVVGTFDENRFSHDGQQLSKEVVRQYHKRTQSEWVEAVGEAKERAKAEDVADWRELCETEPEPLDDHVIDAVRDMYTAGTNAYIDRELFSAPPLSEAVETVRKL
ncbi:phosphoribosylaminoimidazole-succinocarboxamide synthase [Natronomonas pharaonis DSM 2160]|uniref:Phosphoribosylaminoimidazole-succinocarboxamide synthase n=1 Tax=Natronomonas pharaonis (strain ATCC 35678 / DSM 2160 / CIP 103997 / JCM 8858 / NBRC 14720 / NCIMB 2260 / Gabara) TaxID=348780 RepID=A0A1U7EZ60_NATPD|nr:phosphoribosylaminoimidazolesuccinocarboxamide synthase [Natronomonas pharaonis]CAI50589.1 phosphoribosylaminoimidazole-succinocarboxamide synthase [Natronomonas pharaonis DSM 2160]